MIHPERIKTLNTASAKDRGLVLYWMQASQRAEYNHTLEYAIVKANERRKPVVAFFGLTAAFPEANARHYYFMLEGLREVESRLKERGIRLVMQRVSPERGVLEFAKQADVVVVDRGYLKIQKSWRAYVAARVDCPLIQVESDVVVPVEEASNKEEYAAATFRPKISKKLDRYLVPVRENQPKVPSLGLEFESIGLDDVDNVVASLGVDSSVGKVNDFQGGLSRAKRRLEEFLVEKIDNYADLRNDPGLDYVSHMSPYLHFGQISPLYIALRVTAADSPGRDAYLEELVVRRELSMNFVHYNQEYDSYQGVTEWARKSLGSHKKDRREYIYSLKDLENAKTHDPYWNAAQKEMVVAGKMHGYMRMYWGKKILEWSETPERAFEVALHLNNRYELDGRDPNGFTGVAWCFGKHDRPWKERPVFGKVRYMNANGLRRKFDIDKYVEKVGRLTE